jgi:predicted nucleotidyltransferase
MKSREVRQLDGVDMLNQNDRQVIQEFLVNKLNAVTIFLFGSMIHGDTHSESDVDIAFICRKQQHHGFDLFLVAQELAILLQKEVDLIDLHRASTVMQIQVIQNGEILHDACPKDTALLKVKWMKEYARLNEERQCILDQIKESGTIYGV